jgi:hypothetical protein
LPLGHSYRAFGETGGDRFCSEVGAPLSFFRFKISQAANRFSRDVDPDVFGGSVRVADKGSDTAGVEDAIKITTSCLSGVGVLVAGDLDVRPTFVRFLQSLGGIEGILQQPCVHLGPSGRLGDETKEHLTGVDRGIAETPVQDLRADGRLDLDLACCSTVPPTNLPTRDGLALATLASLLGERFALDGAGLGHAVVSDPMGFSCPSLSSRISSQPRS